MRCRAIQSVIEGRSDEPGSCKNKVKKANAMRGECDTRTYAQPKGKDNGQRNGHLC